MSAVSHRLDLNPSDFPRHQERNARQRQRLSPLPAQPEDVVQSSQGLENDQLTRPGGGKALAGCVPAQGGQLRIE